MTKCTNILAILEGFELSMEKPELSYLSGKQTPFVAVKDFGDFSTERLQIMVRIMASNDVRRLQAVPKRINR